MAKRPKNSNRAATAASTHATADDPVTGRSADEEAVDEVNKVKEPESSTDVDDSEAPPKKVSARRARREQRKALRVGNPRWFVPVMLGLFIVGLVWIVVFYLSQTMYPIPNWGYKNLFIGFGILMAGFLMTTRWK